MGRFRNNGQRAVLQLFVPHFLHCYSKPQPIPGAQDQQRIFSDSTLGLSVCTTVGAQFETFFSKYLLCLWVYHSFSACAILNTVLDTVAEGMSHRAPLEPTVLLFPQKRDPLGQGPIPSISVALSGPRIEL